MCIVDELLLAKIMGDLLWLHCIFCTKHYHSFHSRLLRNNRIADAPRRKGIDEGPGFRNALDWKVIALDALSDHTGHNDEEKRRRYQAKHEEVNEIGFLTALDLPQQRLSPPLFVGCIVLGIPKRCLLLLPLLLLLLLFWFVVC